MTGIIGTVKALVGRVQRLRIVRVFTLYSRKNGPILAGGLSLTALYSVFAGLYVGFAIAGFFVAANPEFEAAIVRTLSTSVPGLIDANGSGGAINVHELVRSPALNWGSIVALVILLGTAISWFGSARAAVRVVFDLPPDTTFFLLLKLKDLGLVVGFGIVTLVSAALSVFSTSALHYLFDLVGIDRDSTFATLTARGIGLLIVLALDTATLAGLFRVLSAVRIPWPRLITGSLLGGIALGVLKVLGATIVGGAGRNPLLASFAVIVGLLVWFGLVCQVILLSATWIAVDVTDHGHSLRPASRKRSVLVPPEHRHPRSRAVGGPR